MIEENSDEVDGSHSFNDNENNEEFIRVLDELEVKKRQCLNEQQRVTELEEQLHVISKCIKYTSLCTLEVPKLIFLISLLHQFKITMRFKADWLKRQLKKKLNQCMMNYLFWTKYGKLKTFPIKNC